MTKCYVRKKDGTFTEAFSTGKKHKASCKIEGTRFTSKYTYVTFTNNPDAKEYMVSNSNILSEQEYLKLLDL
ncbi:hypothetical protein VCSRO206_3474 [Vibrio cholerae]|nr:hypothetical protein VCSRO204_3402 [Vibrio cholerae]GHX60067.1 hypothetical protein VCSRO206_3474 [Vibrio cholerae]